MLVLLPDLKRKLLAAGYHDTDGTKISLVINTKPAGYTREDDLISLRETLSNYDERGDDDEN